MTLRYSVVIPAYNSARYIEDCICSALKQTLPALEILVVDDASTDDTAARVTRMAEDNDHIRCIRLLENRGVAEARNAGVREAKGDWIALLDSDDLWLPEKMERQAAHQLETGAQLLYTAAQCMDDSGGVLDRRFAVPEMVTFASMLKGNDIVCSSALVRRDLLLSHPMERPDLHEDYITWMRILSDVQSGAGVQDPLVLYRLAAGSKSRNKLRSALTTWRTLTYLRIPLGRRVISFLSYSLHGIRRYLAR